ncbi:hypothetical protein Q4503_14590 [Colwellia sp. 6_MG-2023]|uniref:hypothetical protein n=1 Tax=Colwellia sp. 6_MG-2023 TaxID=3062676 RepID=UPI0026E18097|nr:hypothetical protein [Colwellia sp. 6_MG-2023]MDO6488931.1 hypothetical protein [Colwellia sp. 6_MG-2023]
MFKVTIKSFLLLCLLTNVSLADNFVQCDNCSVHEMRLAAYDWTLKNVAEGSSISEVINVINFSSFEVISYKTGWEKEKLPMDDWYTWLPTLTEVTASAEIESRLKNVQISYENIKSLNSGVTIPTSAMADAWEYVGCAYCQSRIEEHLSSLTSIQINAFSQAVGSIVSMFPAVDTSKLSNVYKFPLDAGGYAYVNMDVIADSTITFTLVKVVDSDGNEVPKKADDLSALRIYVSTASSNANINSYIRDFFFYIPLTTTGTVTITDCGGTGIPGSCW